MFFLFLFQSMRLRNCASQSGCHLGFANRRNEKPQEIFLTPKTVGFFLNHRKHQEIAPKRPQNAFFRRFAPLLYLLFIFFTTDNIFEPQEKNLTPTKLGKLKKPQENFETMETLGNRSQTPKKHVFSALRAPTLFVFILFTADNIFLLQNSTLQVLADHSYGLEIIPTVYSSQK